MFNSLRNCLRKRILCNGDDKVLTGVSVGFSLNGVFCSKELDLTTGIETVAVSNADVAIKTGVPYRKTTEHHHHGRPEGIYVLVPR